MVSRPYRAFVLNRSKAPKLTGGSNSSEGNGCGADWSAPVDAPCCCASTDPLFSSNGQKLTEEFDPPCPLGHARVFACKESLGKSIPPEWCCTPFSDADQPLSVNLVRISMYFGIFFALWHPCTEHIRTVVRWGCQEEQNHGLGRHAAVQGARVASSVMGCIGRRINAFAPNTMVYWCVSSAQDLIHAVSSFRAVKLHMLCCGTIIIGVSVGAEPTFQRTSTDNRKVSARYRICFERAWTSAITY